ncbi:hypothetical protein [Sphingosinicella sp.]|uniref:hypothetical protein n=1 Tax=Sphingosinicella sp. TaxID=1917971 RepID=UPI00403777D2
MSHRTRARRIAVALLAAALTHIPATPAMADPPRLELPTNLDAVIDLRVVLTDGERSWTDNGFGPARFGGGGEDARIRPVPTAGYLAWHGPIAWSLNGTVAVAAQDEQDQPVDLIQSFVEWRPVPRGPARFSFRAGLYWPEISLEHSGANWQVEDMITPSAINSWIGEEVKVLGLEGTAVQPVGSARLSATLGVFGFNDTAGTLLSFRGWALHDQRSGAFSRQPLPPLNPFMQMVQPQWTAPTTETDQRPGYYARLGLTMAAPVSLNAFYYANRGVPESVTSDLQWGWETRFLNIGARIDLGEQTRLLAQAMTGTTEMGFEENGRYWVETRFRAAYLRLTHEIGRLALSGRVDLFDTRQRGSRLFAEDGGDGWALTGAAAWRLGDQARLLFEWLHVDSERVARVRVGVAPAQSQNVVQAALRHSL